MQFKGHAHVKDVTENTQNFFGKVAAIHGKVLIVIDRNERGDCLCLLPSKEGLIDVDYRDIRQFIPNIGANDPLALDTSFETIRKMLTNINNMTE